MWARSHRGRLNGLITSPSGSDDPQTPKQSQLSRAYMTEYAEAAIACGDQEFAGPLFDRLAPISDQFSSAGGVTAEGPVSSVLGGLATVLGRFDEAECLFTTAAEFSARFAATYFGAATDLTWGQMVVARHADGDMDRARELLGRALTTAEAFGYGEIERRAKASLQRLD